MKILLTGGSGFIGSSLEKRLGKRLRFINYDIKNRPHDDILNLPRLKQSIKKVDGVIHLAAVSRPKWGYQNPHHCLTTNILGTLNVLEAIRTTNPNAWVIFGSSREVFGGVTRFPVTEKSPRLPLNAYAVSKVTGENLLKQYAANYALRCLTLRFSSVYTGIHDITDRVVPLFIQQALQNKSIAVEGNGHKKRFDFVYIDDVTDALERAITLISKTRKGFYDDITLACHDPYSLHTVAQMIIEMTGSKSKIIRTPERSYDVKEFWGSYAKAKKILGWTPRVTLKIGLQKSIQELKSDL